MTDWNNGRPYSWEESFERAPVATLLRLGIYGLILVTVLGTCITPVACVLGYFNDSADTLKKQMSASTLLSRYEWFKDAAAQLDKKQADIAVYEAGLQRVSEAYGKDVKTWPKDAREQYHQRQTELLGLKASFNGLAAEYNAAMAKVNWRFTNTGDLPDGASRPLPREFKPYEMR